MTTDAFEEKHDDKNRRKSNRRKISPGARSVARQRALQALYQWQFTQQELALIESQFLEETKMEMHKVDLAYFKKLLYEIPKNIAQLDASFSPLLDREITQLDPIELTILRIGCYELTFGKDIPFKVVINEAIELAKQFGAEQSHKYVNSILDKFAHRYG
jgi:N utilization substance protein B